MMAINLISLKCPDCGAQLEVEEEGRTQTFCQYCGSKILLINENEHIYRTIDEAAIKKAEVEKLSLEIEALKAKAKEKERIDTIKQKKHAAKKLGLFTLCLFIIGISIVLIFKGNAQIAPYGAIPLLLSFITGILAAYSALQGLGVIDIEKKDSP